MSAFPLSLLEFQRQFPDVARMHSAAQETRTL